MQSNPSEQSPTLYAASEVTSMPKKTMTQKQIDQEVQRGAYVQATGDAATERRITVVLALNALDYQHWCEAHGKNARDPNYIMATPATARGLRNAHFEMTAQGMWRADIHVLMTQLVPMLDAPSVKKLAGMGWARAQPHTPTVDAPRTAR